MLRPESKALLLKKSHRRRRMLRKLLSPIDSRSIPVLCLLRSERRRQRQSELDRACVSLMKKYIRLEELYSTLLSIAILIVFYSNRSVLSEVTRLFDPLGWLASALVRAEILLQDYTVMYCLYASETSTNGAVFRHVVNMHVYSTKKLCWFKVHVPGILHENI